MRLIRTFFIAFGLFAISLQAATITIDMGTTINPAISRAIFGANIGSQNAMNEDVLTNNMKSGQLSSLRFNAGFAAEHFDWYANLTGGSNLATFYSYPNRTTSDVITLCQRLNATPLFTVNTFLDSITRPNRFSYWTNKYPYLMYTNQNGPEGTQFAADWVRYCNNDINIARGDQNPAHAKSYNVTNWEIGNETALVDSAYNTMFRRYTVAMKAIDPSIKVMGPVCAQPTMSKISNFLFDCGDIADSVSFHRYPQGSGAVDTSTLITSGVTEWDGYFTSLKSIIQACIVNKWARPATSVKTAITEWGSTWSGSSPPGPTDFKQTIYIAGVLGKFVENNVFMAHYYHLQNNTCGSIYLSVAPYTPQAPHYAFQFMATHLKDVLVKTTDDVLTLDTYTSQYSNFISLVVINRDTVNPVTATIALGLQPSTIASVYKLTSVAAPAVSTIPVLGTSVNYTFDAASITCIKFSYINGYNNNSFLSITVPVSGGTYAITNSTTINGTKITNGVGISFPDGFANKKQAFTAEIQSSFISKYGAITSNCLGLFKFTSKPSCYADKPITYTLSYDAKVVAPGKESLLAAYVTNSGEWIRISGTLNTNNDTFILTSNHLCENIFLICTDPNKATTRKNPQKVDTTQWSYNPFSPNADGIADTTRIEVAGGATIVVLEIYDRQRRLIRKLIVPSVISGKAYIEWDGKNTHGEVAPPGSYIYNLKIGDTVRKGFLVVAY